MRLCNKLWAFMPVACRHHIMEKLSLYGNFQTKDQKHCVLGSALLLVWASFCTSNRVASRLRRINVHMTWLLVSSVSFIKVERFSKPNTGVYMIFVFLVFRSLCSLRKVTLLNGLFRYLERISTSTRICATCNGSWCWPTRWKSRRRNNFQIIITVVYHR